MTIWFDMDGTLANLYGVAGWLDDLMAENTRPYEIAPVMHNMARLARLLNLAQAKGYKLGVISWTAKNAKEEYNARVAMVKREWLAKHLASVKWDVVEIVAYGTPKGETCGEGWLFDDEEKNRHEWCNKNAFTPDQIFEMLKTL